MTGGLIGRTEEDYGESFTSHLLEQYKLYVQSAENVSSRRVASGRFMLTLSVAIVALYGLQAERLAEGWLALLIPAAGIAVSVLWYLIISSHANLNRVKFEIIHGLEQHLPAAVYVREWQLADHDQGKSYRAISTIERWIPVLFGVIHTVFAAVIGLEIANVFNL